MDKNQQKLENFLTNVKFGEPVSWKDYENDLANANKNRARTVYFIYKTMQEMCPDVDAVELLKAAHRKNGLYSSGCLCNALNATDGLIDQSSRAGMAAWEQTFTTVGEEYAEKKLDRCPLVEALREVGATEEEVKLFCKVIFDAGDQGIAEPYDHLKVSFPKNLAENDVCIMCVKKVK